MLVIEIKIIAADEEDAKLQIQDIEDAAEACDVSLFSTKTRNATKAEVESASNQGLV